MAMATLSSSPYLNPLLQHHCSKPSTPSPRKSSSFIYCRSTSTKKENIGSNNKNSSGSDQEFPPLAKLAVVTLAAGVLALGSAHEAMAAKSGGRVGGQAFRSAAPPRSSGPRINNSRTNIYINPPVAPPLVGGYGYGVPYYGGWGWSPFSFFTPGPSVAVGFGGGLEVFAAMLAFAALAALVRRFRGGRDDDDDY